jgi:hypothetical protein
VGTGKYVNRFAADVALAPLALLTTMFTPPDEWAGDTAVIEVVLLNAADFAAMPPKVTFEVDVKPVPVMTTDVLPVTEPSDGLIFVTAGGAM